MSAGWKSWMCIGIAAFGAVFASAVEKRLRVVATTSQIGDMARVVAGDQVELSILMGSGVDPHLYKASPRDVMTLRRADLILYNGLRLEGRLGETLVKSARAGSAVVAVGEAVPAEMLLASEDYEDAADPHIWFDPELWILATQAAVDALSKADPSRASAYRENGARYQEELRELQAWALERLEAIPEKRRALVTSHDAYGYFGRAFGLEVVGLQGISTATEAGLADVAKLSDFIKQRELPAIFVETSVSPGALERVSSESGVAIGGELFSDAMGAPGDRRRGSDGAEYDVGTYIGMFKYNVDTISTALSGS